MRRLSKLAAGAVLLGATGLLLPTQRVSAASFRWVKANFHAHSARRLVFDDGNISPGDLHNLYAGAGYDLSVHSPHTMSHHFTATDWATQRRREAGTIGVTRTALGQELNVANGPRFWGGLRFGSFVLIPKNNNHLGAFGHDQAVGHSLPLDTAVNAAHAAGGVVTVNHPGPGPGLWEPGYWDRPGTRDKVDAIEVYNGFLLSKVGYFGLGTFEGVYQRATSPQGYDLKVAVSAGTDSHGSEIHRSTACWVLAASNDPADVARAVKARKTVAITGHGFGNLGVVSVDHLGEVLRTGQVDLGIRLDRRVRKIILWKNGVKIRTWRRTRTVRYTSRVSTKATYVWTAVGDFLGRDRLITSAIWYRP